MCFMAYTNINSGETEVLVRAPVMLLLIALIKDVAHGLFFGDVVVVLEQAHLIQFHLSEEGLLPARLPRLLGLRLAGHLLVEGQPGVVESQSQGHLIGGYGANVLLVGTDACDLFVELVGLDGDDCFEDLGGEGGTVCSWVLQMALI